MCIDWWVKSRDRGAVFQEGYSNQDPLSLFELLYQSIHLWFCSFFFFHIYLKPRKKALHQAAAGFWIMWIKLGATRGLTTSYCSLKLLVCACACVCIHVHTRIGEEAVKSHQWGQVIKSCHSANFSKNRLAGYSKPEGHLKKLKL